MLKTLPGTYTEMNMPGGVFVLKKHIMELLMAFMLLFSFYFLSREAAVASKELHNSQKLIIVDPGHGGKDPGMIGNGGLEEKGINLEVARRLKTHLEEMGYCVLLTREGDKGLYDDSSRAWKARDMQNRIALIQEKKPLLTVSIHQNSYQDPAVCGPQVFYYTDSAEGEKLAVILQEKLNTGLEIRRPRSPKGNKSYYLLRRSPGILNIVECGFLTNPSEEAQLQTEAYQERIAAAIAEGIREYLE